MTRDVLFLLAVLGLAWPLAGCATRQFVREETARSETRLRLAIDRLAGDFQEHRTVVHGVAVTIVEADRFAEDATRSAIEARGVADMAESRAADAVDRAVEAGARADQARALADQALAGADRAARRLTDLRIDSTRPAVVETIVLRFGADAWVLDEGARALALEVVRRLQENPALVVELEGHTDAAGTSSGNLCLSQRRAEAVGRFLVEHGVEPHRLRAIGLGPTRPVADNGTREGRRQNRRVVVRLLGAV